ncbi:MAG: glycosyltransferase family 4 protein [Patescibacteria group bacterium]
MLKILYLITQSELGGAQRYVCDLATGMKKEGMDVVVGSAPNAHFYNRLRANDIPFREIWSLKRKIHALTDARLLWELYRLITKEKPDVVHLNSSKIGVAGALAARFAGIPKIIFTAHGWVFNERLSVPRKQFYILASRFAAQFQDHIICVSEYDRAQALRHHIAPEEKFTVIHNGIGKITTFLPKKEARAALGIDEKSIAIGTIANLYRTKSLETIVHAAITAIHAYPDIVFTIIGEGPERDRLTNLIAKYKLEQYFLLTGALPDAQRYLKAFDTFVLPSKKEGLPYTLLEAMAAKLPCVVSDAGGIPEVVESGANGVVVPAMTPTRLWGAIAQLLKNKKMARELGAHAAETVVASFSIGNMLEKTKAIYTATSLTVVDKNA